MAYYVVTGIQAHQQSVKSESASFLDLLHSALLQRFVHGYFFPLRVAMEGKRASRIHLLQRGSCKSTINSIPRGEHRSDCAKSWVLIHFEAISYTKNIFFEISVTVFRENKNFSSGYAKINQFSNFFAEE